MMRSSSISNHVNKVSQQSSQQQVNSTSRPTHHQKDAYWNQMRSNNHPINVSQSHHVSECNVDRLEQEGPTIINSCKLKMNSRVIYINIYRVYLMSLYAGVFNDYGSITWNLKKKKKDVFLYFKQSIFFINILSKRLYQHQNQLFYFKWWQLYFLIDS